MAKDKKTKKEKKNTVKLPKFGVAEDILMGDEESLPAGALVSEVEEVVEKDSISKRGNEEKTVPISAEDELIGEIVVESSKYVTFFLGKEEYGLPIERIKEIIYVKDIKIVPNSPEDVVGVINLRGTILPVIDLKKKLNMGSSKVKSKSRIIVVEELPDNMGLLVDSVPQVVKISSEQIIPSAEEVVKELDGYIKDVARLEEQIVILLNIDRLFISGN